MTGDPPILSLDKAGKVFGGAAFGIRALTDVSFELRAGRALALVGGSGSGKTTCARILTGLEKPSDGTVRFKGRDLAAMTGRAERKLLSRAVQMVFQDPFSALNPVRYIYHHVARPLQLHGMAQGAASIRRMAASLLAEVGLDPALTLERYPHELSGGQRQRVNIARALAAAPEVILADEPTSMLDVSIRLGILGILKRLKTDKRMALLYITHDLATAEYVADDIAVMHKGSIVEIGPARDVVSRPAHAYTRELLAAAPNAGRVFPDGPDPS